MFLLGQNQDILNWGKDSIVSGPDGRDGGESGEGRTGGCRFFRPHVDFCPMLVHSLVN